MTFQPQERTGIRRKQVERAIRLAMDGRWQEAVAANRVILAAFPNDVDSLNRLGKALTELGQYAEAREVYQEALALDPINVIAKKNLARLETLQAAPAKERRAQQAMPHLFIAETGKTGVTILYSPASEALAQMNPGARVHLRRRGNILTVENARGDYLAQVEPKLGLRLLRLMDGGNRYEAALTSVGNGNSKIIIKEVYQHPSQAGKLSFPPSGAGETFRPYIKGGLLRHALDEPFEELDEATEEWEGGAEPHEKEPLYELRRASTLLDEAEAEEPTEELE